MVRLIDDLLDVSRITRGKLELRRSQVALAEVVRNAVDATRPAMEEAGHHFSVRLPEHEVLLYADASRITQVLSNLLVNAAKFTPGGGRIEMVGEIQNGELAISVTDNGRGIASDKLGAIFDMFMQVRDAKESGHQGLGIGLTLVKRLVEMHGGSVTVTSGGLGTGSRFCVRLPAIMPVAANGHNEAGEIAARAQVGQKRVLVVDDNPDALKSLFLLVSLMGHEVRQARDGQEALEVAGRFRPEVIFMDLGMPKLNGYEAARRIREESWGQELLMVATTGWGQEDDRRRTKEAGFDQHLVKPVLAGHVQELMAAPPIGRSCHHEQAAPADGGIPASIAQPLNVTRNFAEQPVKQ
jgi:CheY-like chemotaxis protein